MTADDDEWETRIEHCFQAIRKWESRTSAEDGTSVSGSRIATEDADNPSMTFSVVAWSSIQMAVDHLGLADDAMSRMGGANLRPFALYTLCRGALVAASQAIWVMTGGRDVRLRRLRFVELAELDGMRNFLRDYSNDKSLKDSGSEDVVEKAKNKANRIDDRHRAVKQLLKPEKPYEGSVTRMLKDSAAFIVENGRNDPWLARAYLSVWRLASGAAHARIWPGDFRPHETVPIVGQRARLRVSTGTLKSYGVSIVAATTATSEAFRLWDLHAGRPLTIVNSAKSRSDDDGAC